MHWTYRGDLPSARIHLLQNAATFDEIVELMCNTVVSGYVLETPTSRRLSGLRRPSFLLNVAQNTYDLFFNSPSGYRGQYALSLEAGLLANRKLIDRLTPQLIEYQSSYEPFSTHDIATSLAAIDSKVWIVEAEVESQMGSYEPDIHYLPWEAASENGAGLLAPIGSKLEVKGSWLDSNGSVHLDPAKARRGNDIHTCGYS